MAPPPFLLGLVLALALLLIGLAWWRCRGGGRRAERRGAARFRGIRPRTYDVSDFMAPPPEAGTPGKAEGSNLLAELLEGVDPQAATAPEQPEEGEEPLAPSLFDNPLTAPPPAGNRRRVALRAKLTNEKKALGKLFQGNPATGAPEDSTS